MSCYSPNPSSTLASVLDNATNSFLTNLTGGSEWTWIGGYQDDDKIWTWADESEWTGYNNWGPGRTIVTHTNQQVGLGFSNTNCKCRL